MKENKKKNKKKISGTYNAVLYTKCVTCQGKYLNSVRNKNYQTRQHPAYCFEKVRYSSSSQHDFIDNKKKKGR